MDVMRDAGFADFDFLIGEWHITNEFLKERLRGSDDWETFPATSRVERVMDGAGNLDQMSVPARGFTGMTLRLYDPAARLWSIYWSDTKSFRLFPPTIGRFENGRGEFFRRRHRRRHAGAGALPVDPGKKPALGTVVFHRRRADVGTELGDEVRESVTCSGDPLLRHLLFLFQRQRLDLRRQRLCRSLDGLARHDRP
jgi:hypothetical protein